MPHAPDFPHPASFKTTRPILSELPGEEPDLWERSGRIKASAFPQRPLQRFNKYLSGHFPKQFKKFPLFHAALPLKRFYSRIFGL
jgi:hypothetical protein